MSKVEIYTDGACRGNPGPGGWGVLLRYGAQEKLLKGSEAHTTNNKMELKAAIEGLKAVNSQFKVMLVTDSQYVKNGITNWIVGWQANNWRTANKKPVKNQELWQELHELVKHREIEWQWVRGHNGHVENEIVDSLANVAIDEMLLGN